MIKIDRPERPNISIYKTKRYLLDRNKNKDQALRDKLLTLIEDKAPFKSIVKRLKASPKGKFTKAEVEMLKAIAFFADRDHFDNDVKITQKQNPKFDVYKNDKLKIHLKDTFKNKCAYCESDFTHATPPDIEHFRPKAAINPFNDQEDEALIYPGYYWLGAEWDNLLWSCPLCNRKTKQEVPDSVELVAVGKKNRFPIAGNHRVRHHHEGIASEEPHRLLIDPCKDDPALHLEFTLDGLVVAKLNADDEPSPMGEASIPAYALNRADLKHSREVEILNLEGLLIGLVATINLFGSATDPLEKEHAKAKFLRLKTILKSKFAPKASYLAQKQVVLDHFFETENLEAIGLRKEDLLN